MAFNLSFLSPLLSAKKTIDSRINSENATKKIVSVGYPDLIFKNSDRKKLISLGHQKFIQSRPEAMQWHGLNPEEYSYFSIQKLFEFESWKFDYLDIKQGTGSDSDGFIEVDLNQSIPNHLYSSYDILIDSGTAEHCFNIGKVFENYFHLLKPGGILFQYIPFLSPNHGFWSMNPTAAFDLASCNPIKVLDCKLLSFDSYKSYFKNKANEIKFLPTGRFSIDSSLFSNTVLMFFVYKKYKKSIFRYPVQAKYRGDN